jgi:hypothetical protein
VDERFVVSDTRVLRQNLQVEINVLKGISLTTNKDAVTKPIKLGDDFLRGKN